MDEVGKYAFAQRTPLCDGRWGGAFSKSCWLGFISFGEIGGQGVANMKEESLLSYYPLTPSRLTLGTGR